MKERGISFTAPMVRAILEGRKTQTRRIVKWKPREVGINLDSSSLKLGHYLTGKPEAGWVLGSMGAGCWNDRTYPAKCPHGVPGDRLCVLETLIVRDSDQGSDPEYLGQFIQYAADARCRGWTHDEVGLKTLYPFKRNIVPSIFMPRWASRITLELIAVRVERLNDISEADAVAEGIIKEDLPPDSDNFHPPGSYGYVTGLLPFPQGQIHVTAVQAYRELWNSIHTDADWFNNPYVWVEEFRAAGSEARP